jgi:hypothetical protein
MAHVPMWPPANGALNTITFDGRTYSSVPGSAIQVFAFDVAILQANGWTTFATVAGQNYVPMTPPTSRTNSNVSFEGRTYSATPGQTINVPSFDAGILQANGWTNSYSITLQALSLSSSTFNNDMAAGAVVANVLNTSGGIITLNALSPLGSLTISGTQILVGPTPPSAPAAITFNLVETLAGATNSPHTTSGFSISETVGAPLNTAAPSISGTAQVGQSLTAWNGIWTNSPTAYSYIWTYSGGGSVAGTPSSNTYVPVSADVGQQIIVSVTAANAAGNSAPASSGPTSAVTSAGGSPSLNFSIASSSQYIPALAA